MTSALAGSSSGEPMNTARMLMIAIVPRVTISERRTRSGTALTVVPGASSVRAVTAGAVPRATPSSV